MESIVVAPTEAEEKQMVEGVEEETVETEATEEVKEEPKTEVKEDVKEKKPTPEEIAENLKIALRQTREEMKEIKRKADLADELKKQFDEYRSSLKPKEEVKIPVYDEDPLGNLKAETDGVKRAQDELRNQLRTVNETTEQQRIVNYASSIEDEFRKTAPDYDNAFQYMTGLQQKQMELAGIPEDQIAQNLAAQAFNFTKQAISKGKNPAQLIYEYAKLYGYKAPAKEETKPKVDEAVSRLETVQKGMEKAVKTLSKGGQHEVPVNVQQLLEAKGEDFEKQWQEFFNKA